MNLVISPEQLVAVATRLHGRHPAAIRLVRDVLADLGLVCVPTNDGGYEFECILDRAKRLVVEELMKCVTK